MALTHWPIYKRLFAYLRPHAGVVALALVALMLLGAIEPLGPWLLQHFIDAFAVKNQSTLIVIALAIAGVFLAKGVLEYLSVLASNWIAHQVVMEVRQAVFAKMTRLALPTQQARTSGEWMSLISFNATNLGGIISQAWIVVIKNSLLIVGLMAFLLYTSWRLTLFVFVLVPITAWLMHTTSLRMRQFSEGAQHHMGALSQHIQECVQGIRDIKMYASEWLEAQRFNGVANNVRRAQMALVRIEGWSVPLTQVLAAICLSLCLLYVVVFDLERFTAGRIVGFLTAMGLLFEPLRQLAKVNRVIQQGVAAAASVFAVLDSADEAHDEHDKKSDKQGDEQDNKTDSTATIPSAQDAQNALTNAPLFTRAIRLDAISLTYPGARAPSLDNLSLTIEKSKTVALVGASGAGKSSIINVLTGFYAPTAGTIWLDDISAATLPLAARRARMALVSQHITLFNRTLAENIAYGGNIHDERAAIDNGRLEAAINASQAAGFIHALPDGLNTVIGENGMTLSGGQRQRIALARAFYKNAELLLLDEATSALDTQTEHALQQALAEYRKNHTVLVIAHRLSTVMDADTIVVMDKGHIIAQGTHAELLKTAPNYRALVKKDLR